MTDEIIFITFNIHANVSDYNRQTVITLKSIQKMWHNTISYGS